MPYGWEAFEIVGRKPHGVCSKDGPFGGILAACLGDFRQLQAVVKNSNVDITDGSIKESYLWRHFTIFNWFTNMRLNELTPSTSSFRKTLKNAINKITATENIS